MITLLSGISTYGGNPPTSLPHHNAYSSSGINASYYAQSMHASQHEVCRWLIAHAPSTHSVAPVAVQVYAIPTMTTED